MATLKPEVEPRWLPLDEARRLNEADLAESGGGAAIVDTESLERALQRARMLWGYHDERDVVRLACGVLAGILEERPFARGNLSTALASLMLFLRINGYRWSGPDGAVLAAYVQALADGRYTEEGLAETLRPDVFPS